MERKNSGRDVSIDSAWVLILMSMWRADCILDIFIAGNLANCFAQYSIVEEG
jgi:hypothetical protein